MTKTGNNSPTQEKSSFSKADAILATFLGLFAFILYVRTLTPGLATGDSAEFQTLSYTLGMTHPTGYPIYLLLGKAFTLLPVANIAYRVNLLSAASAATAVALVYCICRRLSGQRMAAMIGAAVLCTTGIFWSQAVVAELYAPAAMMLSAVLLALVTWSQTEHWVYLFIAGLLGGLSIGVHNTVTLFSPAVLVFMLLKARRPIDWFAAIAGAALGLVLWFCAFLFIDARQTATSFYNSVALTALSGWGLTPAEFDTPLKRLAYLLGATQFRSQMFSSPFSELILSTQNYWNAIKSDFSLLARVLIIIGLPASLFHKGSYKTGWKEALLLLLALVAILGFVLNYGIPDIHVFYIPTYVLLAVYCGLGASAISYLLADILHRLPGWEAISTRWLGLVFSTMLVLGIIFSAWPTTISRWEAKAYENRTNISRLESRARQTINHLEEDAILLTSWMDLYIYSLVSANWMMRKEK